MSTDLRLLIDEDVPAPLARGIISMSSVKAVYVLDIPSLVGCHDDAVIAFAEEERRVTLTLERAFKRYKVCTHQGIIVLASRERHEVLQEEIFRRFILSGYRQLTKNSFTRLTHNEAAIRDHSGEEKVYRF